MTGTGKTTGKLSLGTVMIDSGATGSNQAEICAADNTATITNIDATSGTPELKLLYYFTTPSAKAAGVSLLSINGTINKVKVHLWPNIRQYNTMYNQYSTYPNGSPLYEVIPITKLSDIFNVLSDTKPEYAEYKGKTICGTTKTWNSEMGWYNRKLLTLPKAGIDNIDVYNNTTLWEYKSGQAMYLAEDMPGIQVMGFANEAFSSKTYDGSFFDLAEAVAEINRIGSKKEGEANSIVVILFKENIGTSTSPVALTLPTSIRALELQSDSLYGQIIYTTTTTLNASYDLGLYSLEIIPRAKGPVSKVYNVNTQMSINTGKNKLRLSKFYSCTYSETHIKDITCGTLDSPDINLGVTGKINVSEDFNLGQGLAANTVNVGKKMNVTCGSSRTVNISGALTVGDLTVSNSSLINVGTMLTANNLTLRNSTTVNAANITVKATTELGESSILRAGRAFVGDNAKTVKDKATDGKITLKDVEFKGGTGSSATISVKNAPLDKNGRTSGSQLTVTGNVTCGYSLDPSTFVENNKEPIQVEIRENTEGGSETAFTNVVCPSGGMLLVTAPNASDWFFRPSTSMMNLLYSTHYLKLYGKIIKSGKNIIFDRVNARFRLHVLATSLLSTSPKAKTAIDTDGNGIINMEDGYQYDYKCYIDFETYEDAVNQINTLNRFKMIDDDGDYIPDRVSQYYEDYFIEYIDSAYDTYDIKNAAGAYVALPLPAKAGEVNLYSGTGSKLEMRFLGAITLKSHLTIADGVSLVPVVKASGVYEDTYSAINLGTYRLRLFNDYTKYHVSDAVDYAPISPSSITGSTNSRLVITTQNNGKLAFICTGNISVPYLEIDLNGNSADAEFTVFGNLTVTKLSLISAQSACAYVGCGQNVTFTDIEVQGHICPRFEIYKSKLIKLNGQVTGYHSEKMIVYMEDAKDIGTVYVTGPKINAADWQLLDCTETCRNSYKVGNNLMLGYN